MRWGASASASVHAGLVLGLALLPPRPHVVKPPPSVPLEIHPVPERSIPQPLAIGVDTSVGIAHPEPGPAPHRGPARPSAAATQRPSSEPAPAAPVIIPSPAAVARGLVPLEPSIRSPLDPAPARPRPQEALPGVQPDGRVRFPDLPEASSETISRDGMKRVLKEELEEWARDPYTYYGKLHLTDGPVPGRWRIKPTNPLALPGDDRDNEGEMIYIPLMTGTFDVTDEIARRRGGKTLVSHQQRFMDETLDQRADMAVAERARLGGEAVYRMSERLAKLWEDDRRSPRERRALLFALWDECEDTHAGRAARASIVGFIRRRLPAGTPEAFPGDELAELNRRRTSRAPFSPY